jgi:hypothetical protein
MQTQQAPLERAFISHARNGGPPLTLEELELYELIFAIAVAVAILIGPLM